MGLDVGKQPIVLCVTFESYVSAIACMDTLSKSCPDIKERIEAAAADFKASYDAYMKRSLTRSAS
jgi:hypothetical protein